MKRKRKNSRRIAPMSKFERMLVRRALNKPTPIEAQNQEWDIRLSVHGGDYERAMVAAALREAAGK